MDEKSIKAEMRLYVIETFLVNLFAMMCLRLMPFEPLKAFEEIKDTMIGAIRKQTFSQVDPAMSDLLSAEIESAATRLASLVSGQISLVLKAREAKKDAP